MILYRFLILLALKSSLGFAQATYGPEFELMGRKQMDITKFCGGVAGVVPAIFFSYVILNTGKDKQSLSEVPAEKLITIGALTTVFSSMLFGLKGAKFCQSWMVDENYEKLKLKMISNCMKHDCKVEKVNVKSVRHKEHKAFKVTYPDGFYFVLDKDITAVEIQMKPVTLKQLEKRKAMLQRDIFDLAGELEIKAYRSSDWLSQGHINIGRASAFGDDDLLLRNFIVDQLNHPELASGVLSNDKHNAKTPMLSEAKRNEIEIILKEYDRGKLEFKDFARKLQRTFGGSMTSLSLNTLYMEKDDGKLKFKKPAQRVEIRAHRAQNDIEEFYLLAKMYENRIEYLKQFKSPIPFINKKPARKMAHKFIAFRAYLEEMGLDPKDYQRIFPKRFCRHFLE